MASAIICPQCHEPTMAEEPLFMGETFTCGTCRYAFILEPDAVLRQPEPEILEVVPADAPLARAPVDFSTLKSESVVAPYRRRTFFLVKFIAIFTVLAVGLGVLVVLARFISRQSRVAAVRDDHLAVVAAATRAMDDAVDRDSGLRSAEAIRNHAATMRRIRADLAGLGSLSRWERQTLDRGAAGEQRATAEFVRAHAELRARARTWQLRPAVAQLHDATEEFREAAIEFTDAVEKALQ